jgi:hypothetical protein
MKFAMECFNSYPLVRYITRSNSSKEAKYQMPLGVSELKKLELYEMLNLKKNWIILNLPIQPKPNYFSSYLHD